MERNHRPISRATVLALAEQGFDIAPLDANETARLIADMREALADPVFDQTPALAELEVLAANAPKLAHSFLSLHRAHRAANERLAALDDRIGREDSAAGRSPWEEVRDFFHYCDNYIDAVDKAAEGFVVRAGGDGRALAGWLESRHGVTVQVAGDALRRFDPASKTLTLAPGPAHVFHLAHQIALVEPVSYTHLTLPTIYSV